MYIALHNPINTKHSNKRIFTINLKVTHSIHRRNSYLCDYSTIKFIEALDCDNAQNFQEIADLKKSTSEIPTNRDSNRSHMTGNIYPMNVHTELFSKFAHLCSQPAKNNKKANFRRFLEFYTSSHSINLSASSIMLFMGHFIPQKIMDPCNQYVLTSQNLLRFIFLRR